MIRTKHEGTLLSQNERKEANMRIGDQGKYFDYLEEKLPVGDHIEKIHQNDVIIHSVLGSGTFSCVFHVQISSRKYQKLDAVTANPAESPFALKCLRPNKVNDEDCFLLGVFDLVCEASDLVLSPQTN